MESYDEARSVCTNKTNTLDTTHNIDEADTKSLKSRQVTNEVSHEISRCEDATNFKFVDPSDNRIYSQHILRMLHIRVNNALNLHFENRTPCIREDLLFEDLLEYSSKSYMDSIINANILDSCMLLLRVPPKDPTFPYLNECQLLFTSNLVVYFQIKKLLC